MDVKALHTAYAGSNVAAAHALIAASGEVKPSITQSHTAAAIQRHSNGSEINWPRVLRDLARREPGPNEG